MLDSISSEHLAIAAHAPLRIQRGPLESKRTASATHAASGNHKGESAMVVATSSKRLARS